MFKKLQYCWRKSKFMTYFLTYLIIYLTDFYTSCIGMCEITYLTHFIKGCKYVPDQSLLSYSHISEMCLTVVAICKMAPNTG